MRWLITGGCGFIGANLVASLVEQGGAGIRVVDNLSVGNRDDLRHACDYRELDPAALGASGPVEGAEVELVVGGILDEELALRVTQGVDVIVHLAASTGVAPSVADPRRDCLMNVVGTLNYLEGARHNGVRRFVYASSGAALGEQEPPLHENLVARPVSPYGASKLCTEAYGSAYFRTFGVETVGLRFSNVYGPRSRHKESAIHRFIKRALVGEQWEVYGDGNQTRDFIFVEDLNSAIMQAARVAGIGGEVFQIATNVETSLLEVIRILERVLMDAGVEMVPIQHGEPRRGDVKRNYADTSKAQCLLQWRATVDLTEGLRRTVNWYAAVSNRV